ncbi:amidase [Nocardia sp. NBC_01329]|uniref:amidase n=1 Tax=Nocardia sp. NBC_01329 TaxID=2903594 RepID=UPI002E1537D3|nr:amidase [Nocardia sp. NBC_01329]
MVPAVDQGNRARTCWSCGDYRDNSDTDGGADVPGRIVRAAAETPGEVSPVESTAAELRYRRGESLGPLDGVVISVKDIIAVEGMQWEAGSEVLRGNLAAADAAAVAALRRSGCVIVGKTSLDEFALTTTGPAVNPHDDRLTAGGSSCGSAVAVRSSMSFFDLATDTGGSTRIPAYRCGVTGLKPTRSLLSTDGVVPLAHSLDHLGLITRSARDCAIAFDSMLPGTPPERRTAFEPRNLRVGVPSNLHFYGPDAESGYHESIATLISAGMSRVEFDLPDLDILADIHKTILLAEMREFHGRRFGRSEHRYGPGLEEFLWNAQEITNAQYLEAQRRRDEMTAAISELFTSCDLLLLPTLLVDTPLAGQSVIDLGGAPTFATTAMVRLTSLFDHTGHPALTVSPHSSAHKNLAGVQLVAAHYDDMFLLDVAQFCGA